MRWVSRILLGAWAAFLLPGCGPEKVAGGQGNGSETTNGVTARILYPDGRPAAGMAVRLRPADFLRGHPTGPAGGAADRDTGARKSADTSTDSFGAFAIRGLAGGEYLIEIRDDSLYGVIARLRMDDRDSVVDLRDMRLERRGRLVGRVSRDRLDDSVDVTVLFYGLDRDARCAADGSFDASLAPGAYSLKVTASLPEAGSIDLPQVVCLPGAETRLAELSLPIDYRADSLAVAGFLRDAGLEAAEWRALVGVENNRIRTLNLGNLGLTSLPSSVEKLAFLRSLLLDGNPVASLPQELSALSGLQTLSLHGVALDTLPAIVTRLISLKYLDLGRTGLKAFPPALANLKGLEGLSLDSNSLVSIPAAIGGLTALFDLDLGKNGIQSLPPEIGSLVRLHTLSVNDNVLDSLPYEIGQLGKLVRLWAYHNRIRSLPASLGNLSGLEILHLEGNLIPELPPEIGKLTQVRYLYLGDNGLSALPESITGLKPDRHLSLWHNRLCQVPPAIKAWIDSYDSENFGGRSGNIWADLQVGCP